MIRVRSFEDNKYRHFMVDGHAGYCTDGGFDYVCGMVSVLAQSALCGCQKHCKQVNSVCESGSLRYYFPKDNKIARAITEACAEGIRQVSLQFPRCFDEVSI